MRAQLCPSSISYPHHLNPHSKPSSTILNLSHPRKHNFFEPRKLDRPWHATPPPPPPPPSGIPFHHQVNHIGIPFSLRLVQLRRKTDKLARTPPAIDPAKLGPVGNAVWTLATLLQKLQKSALPVADEAVLDEVLTEGTWSVVCLFQRVFSSSPEIALRLLVMMAEFMTRSVGSEARTESEEREGDLCADYIKTKNAYEHLIVTGEGDSLILANYAQFLYLFENDLDRADDYFNLAVNAEPVDWEAMSRYAFFLWHARGDIERAEEMFLEAIQAHPGDDDEQQCTYARFLYDTGSADTCYPLTDCTMGDGVYEDDDKLSSL